MSPSTIENDQVLKRRLYEAAGVPEYWIVDPFEHTITQLVLGSQGSYESAMQDLQITTSILPSVSLDLSHVW